MTLSKLFGSQSGVAIAGGVLALAAVLAAPVASARDAQVPAVTIKYKDLNLGTDAGARVLYRRIVTAASAVCVRDTPSLNDAMLVAQCRKAAVARAVSDVSNSRVAAIYAAASGQKG